MTRAMEGSPQSCAYCGNTHPDLTLRHCATCKQMLYCSKACQAGHWTDHRKQCRSYSRTNVKPVSTTKPLKSNKPTCAALVGKQCLVQCYIQGLLVDALWDTGSQVCIVSETWKDYHLPNVRLRDISEAIEAPEELRLVAANGQDIPYIGWIEVTFGLVSDKTKDSELTIPVLVMRGRQLCHPIIGYNVIEQIANRTRLTPPNASELVVTAIPNVEGNKIQAFIKRVQAEM